MKDVETTMGYVGVSMQAKTYDEWPDTFHSGSAHSKARRALGRRKSSKVRLSQIFVLKVPFCSVRLACLTL